MRTIFIILSVLFSGSALFGQGVAREAEGSLTNNHILYRGADNPVEIAVPSAKTDKLKVIVTNGTVKRVSGVWIVNPGPRGETVITIYDGMRIVSQQTFAVLNMPDPKVLFGGLSGGVITKETAMAADRLVVELPGIDRDLNFTIEKFILFWSDGTNDMEEMSEGCRLTDKMKSVIINSKTGQVIGFKNIWVIGPDGNPRNIKPVVFKII